MTTQATFSRPTGTVRLGYKKYLKLKRAQDVIEALAWATVLAVTVMFLVDGGLKGITDLPSALNAFSRLTALVATDLLLIHMLLIARIPWIDKFYGHDRATLAHKRLGKPVLYIIVAHFIASTLQYAIGDGKNVIDECSAKIRFPPNNGHVLWRKNDEWQHSSQIPALGRIPVHANCV